MTLHRLKTGDEVVVRPIGPKDKPRLADLVRRASPESLYRRFFSPTPMLTSSQLRYLTEIDHHGHEALQAVHPRTGQALGVARFVRLPDQPTVAEVAIGVVDDWHRRGLATILLHKLAARAREEGIERFSAWMLEENNPAMELFRGLGEARVTGRDHGLVEMIMDLPHEGASDSDSRTRVEGPARH